MCKISVIIAVHLRPDFLEKIFISLTNQTFKDFEVVIAEDGRDVGIAAVLRTYSDTMRYPILHASQDNEGFRKTIIANKAVLMARSEYLVFIDGDCILHHRFLERHYANRKPHTILSGRRVKLNETGTANVTNDSVKSLNIEKISFWSRHCSGSDIKKGIYIPFSCAVENIFQSKYTIVGSNFSLFKKDFIGINGYDERIIGRGMEDGNLCERFRVQGYPVRTITREAIQYHMFHTSSPIPHSKEAYAYFGNPKESWTPSGIQKSDNPAV